MANPQKDIVLLMHDRAFRKSHDCNPACSDQYKPLAMLKQYEFSFGILSKFLKNDYGT
jgi:hypothetical protein